MKEDNKEFIEWVLELLPPKYDCDVTRRFTPQVQKEGEPMLWVYNMSDNTDAKFLTTDEVYDMYLKSKILV